MRVPTRIAAVLIAAVTMLVGLSLPASAHGRHGQLGQQSLVALLSKDTSGYDHNWNDYDILTKAVGAVLAADPNDPVAVLGKGDVALTAFLPTDRAFRRLAHDITGKRYTSEEAVFDDLATKVGVPTLEQVLLYHVVPGKTVTYRQVLRLNGAKLTTALNGSTVKVRVRGYCYVSLVDADTNDRNPVIVRPNLNKGNLQIAHGINRVLRPVDLP